MFTESVYTVHEAVMNMGQFKYFMCIHCAHLGKCDRTQNTSKTSVSTPAADVSVKNRKFNNDLAV